MVPRLAASFLLLSQHQVNITQARPADQAKKACGTTGLTVIVNVISLTTALVWTLGSLCLTA